MSILQRPTGTDDLGCTQSPELFAKPARFRAVGAVVAVLALGVIVGAQANAQGSADFNQAQVLAQELAQAGRALVERDFDWRGIVPRLEEVYRSLDL